MCNEICPCCSDRVRITLPKRDDALGVNNESLLEVYQGLIPGELNFPFSVPRAHLLLRGKLIISGVDFRMSYIFCAFRITFLPLSYA